MDALAKVKVVAKAAVDAEAQGFIDHAASDMVSSSSFEVDKVG
jgi:hypothetical protein